MPIDYSILNVYSLYLQDIYKKLYVDWAGCIYVFRYTYTYYVITNKNQRLWMYKRARRYLLENLEGGKGREN